MENNSIREFTCNDCQEVTKVDWSKVRPDLDDGTSNIEIHEKGNGYAYYGECMNCGNLVEIEPPVPELVVDNVDVDKDGIHIQLTDTVTNRSCWIEAWQDESDEWEYDFNQYIFHFDDDNDVIAKMFQEDLGNYSEEVFDCVMRAIDDHEEEYNKLQGNKAPTMRDRLKEAKAGTVSIKAYGKVYYEFSEEEWNSKSEEEKEATIADTADQATDEEGHTVYEDEVEVITESRKVTEAKDDLEGIKNLIVYEKTQNIFEELYHNEHLDCEYNGSNGVVKITSIDEHTFNIIDKIMVDKLHYSKLSNYVYELNEGPIYRDIKGGFDFKGYSYKVDVKFTLNEKDTIVGTVGISEIDVKKENKNLTEDTTSSEFNLYIKPEELSDVNISSLLFDSNTVIADYKEGNYMLSLIVRGDIKIYDNETGYAYKNYQDFPVELQNLIRAGALGSEDAINKYTVDMNNWFEWFLDEVNGNATDTLWYDVADIEGMLNKSTPEENETELEVIMKDLFDDIVGQLNEDKKVESKKVKTESKRKAINIEWDTDGEDVDLPTEIEIPDDIADEDIGDYITDETGFCHFGFDIAQDVKTESAPADVIEYFGMQDNTDEEYKNNVAKEYKKLRAKYPDKEMILNGDFGTYLGTEKATPVEKGEYITVYNKVEENVNIEISEDGKEVEVTTDDHEEVEVKDETPEDDDKNQEDTENNESENEKDTEEGSIDDISLSESTNNHLSFSEFVDKMRKAYDEDKSLTGVIVFTENSFDKPYSLEARSYRVSNQTSRRLQSGKIGNSLFGNCLDGSEEGVRLDWYMGEDGWKVDYCYIENNITESKKIKAVDEKQYEVSLAVKGYYKQTVWAKDEKEAYVKVDNLCADADFGELEDIEWEKSRITTLDESKKVTETVDEENSLNNIANYIKGIVGYNVSITPTGNGFSSYDVNFLNTDNSIMYSIRVNDDAIGDKVRLLNTLILELKRLYSGKTFADIIRENLLNELNRIHPIDKKVTESKISDMDTVDIVMELEGGELTIVDVDDWNKVKEVAKSLQGSQGFYGRLLRSMLESEEEFGGVENLPFPITM